MRMESEFLAEFTKSGSIITNALGIANVVFVNQIPYGTSYSVLLTCKDPGVAAIAYPSNEMQTGFTITTKDTIAGGGGYQIRGSVTVYWLVVPQFNS
jgi:hypothetical protein